jgi:hypothetical protein
MKTNFFIFNLLLTVAIAFAACSKNNETPDPEPDPDPQETALIEISESACSFTSSAVGIYSISVKGTDKWDVRNEAAWVIAEKQPDNTLRVTTIPSRLPHDRTATVTIVAANEAQGEASFTVKQDPGTSFVRIRILPGGIALRYCSENGLWATGQKGTAVRVVNIEEILKDKNYSGTVVTMDNGVHSIDNNGKPYSGGCSADGTIYSEYAMQRAVDDGGPEWWPAHYTPYIMRNNRRIDLSYPSTYTTSNIVEDGYAPRHYYQGCIPDKMSADGKYIYGRLMNVNNGWFACKWTRVGATNDYTFKELGLQSDGDLNVWEKKIVEHEGEMFMTVEPVSFLCPQNSSGLSLNGKYACGHYGESLGGGGQLFRYDMDADRLELLPGTNGIALYITDDGTLFDSNNRVWKLGSTTSITLREWLTEIYGETAAGQVYPGYVMGSVSADYSTTVLFDLSYPIDEDTNVAATCVITVVSDKNNYEIE